MKLVLLALLLVIGISAHHGTAEHVLALSNDCKSVVSRRLEPGELAGISYQGTLVQAKLPAGGGYITTPVGPVGTDVGVEICHVESGAYIRIGLDGREVSRVAGDAAANDRLDQIMASVTVGVAPPLPAPVSPPRSGDGGLLSTR